MKKPVIIADCNQVLCPKMSLTLSSWFVRFCATKVNGCLQQCWYMCKNKGGKNKDLATKLHWIISYYLHVSYPRRSGLVGIRPNYLNYYTSTFEREDFLNAREKAARSNWKLCWSTTPFMIFNVTCVIVHSGGALY